MIEVNSLNTKLDLRAPVFTSLRKRIYVEWLRVMTLILMDATLLYFAWHIAETFGTPLDSSWDTRYNPLSLLPVLAAEIGLIAVQGLYQSGEKRRDYLSLIKILTFSQLFLLILTFLYQQSVLTVGSNLILFWLLSIGFTCSGQIIFDFAMKQLRKQGVCQASIFLICHSEQTEKATKLINRENWYNLVGSCDISYLNGSDIQCFTEKIRKLGVSQVFVCSWNCIKERIFLYWSLRNAGITLYILPNELESFSRKSEYILISGQPFIKLSSPIVTGSDFWLKRCFDIVFSALLLFLTTPLFLVIALLIKLDSPGSVFYKQSRVGLHNKEFKVWKFRTMVSNADKLQKELEAFNEMKDGVLFKMKSDPRITRVGNFLRRYSLDELPQLFNVILGQMSLVGPRPLPLRDVQNFSKDDFFRHEVLPGITGIWQVSGRSNITNFEQVMLLDMFYIENWSLQLDLQILLQTIVVLVKKQGAY